MGVGLMERVSNISNKILCALKREKDEFKKMSKAEKRVAIARDVIAQIKCENYVPECGTYVSISETDKAEEIENVDEKPIDQMLAQGAVQCTVCAKGAMFMSHLRKDSKKISVGEAGYGEDEQHIEDTLNDLFSEEQLDAIESAFETDSSFYTDEHGGDYDEDGELVKGSLGEKAERFGNKYSDSQRRLIGIMNNIIKNKGEFKP